VPNLVGDDRQTVLGTTPDNVLEDRHDGDFNRPVVEDTAIDDVVLGAPLDRDSSTTNNILHLPAISPIATPIPNPRPTEPLHPRIEAGCVWDSDNWSCAYDAVFMSFWSMYRKSSPSWRSKWKQQAPKWNDSLGAAFDSLLSMARNDRTSQVALSRKFTLFRDMFRDELSRTNPVYFRRHGTVQASVCRILGHIFGTSIESEPHLDQVLACDQCDISIYERCSFSLIGSTQLLDGYLNEDDVGPFLPLQTAVTRYIQHISQEPHCDCCRTCSGPLGVESVSIPEMAWLWVELCDLVSPVVPSLRLVFGLQDQRQVYTLQAVIYQGGNHFTARLSNESSTWWKCDGRWRLGAPRVDRGVSEVDLLENDGRRAAFLLYCRADFQD